ncbi:hypothetical protein GGC65_000820 [Sphingopyxis sp. OAS728]|uniref:PEPxxWA-CTERM sorting domain-containing protein n=1 Tax=Sphingopyxis sp. OAS728 TaxID=2663823 RepID=UPI0019FCC54F|nr:PEPxxWA-CTERM sorting domain-containing protein [Sphingopyxis sp. OAS728]MBE1526364.1 hypothetical protein [Sphingopyxis sp. OAS728]
MAEIKTFLGSRLRVGAMAIALLLLAIMSMTIPAFSGDGGKLLAQTTDVLERFVGRSPGERDETDLLKGKKNRDEPLADRLFGRRINGGGDPEQRALGKIFDTPPEDSIKELVDGPPGPLALGEPVGSGIPALGDVGGGSSSGFPGGISTVVPSGPAATPGGPNPGNPTPGGPTDPGVTPPVAAVPEPGTWALMLIGFGLCGAVLRRRRRSLPPGSSSNPQCEPA